MMKKIKINIMLVVALIWAAAAMAQTPTCDSGYTWQDTIVVNGTNTSIYLPLGSVASSGQYYHTFWSVYSREEIEGAGIYPGSTIRQVGFRMQSSTIYGASELSIYMKEVPVRALNATADSVPLDSMSLVYTSKGSGSVAIMPGWNYIVLDTAFAFSGRGHLMIAVQRNGNAGGISDRRFYATNGNSVCRYKSQFGASWVSQLRTGASGRPVLALRVCAGPDVCPRPAVQFTATDSSITVHMGQHDSLYHVVLGSVGFQPDTVGLYAPLSWLSWDDTVRYTNLNPGTKYDIYVRRRCGDYYSLWAGPFTVSTFCGVQPLPYTLSLTPTNAADAFDSCWVLHDAVLNGVNLLPRNPTPQELDSALAVKAVAVLPQFDAPLSSLHFNYSGVVGLREVGVVTDPDDPATFVPYDTLNLADWGIETDFSRYRGPQGRLAIRWEQGRAFSRVTVDTIGGCYAPFGAKVDSVVDTTVYVSWRNRTPGAAAWRVSYSTHPTDFNYYTTVQTDTTALRIDSLLPNRYYYLRLRSICDDSTMSNYYTNTLKFLTACRPINRLPYRMDASLKLYSSGEMPCWTETTDTTTNLKYFISPLFDTSVVRMDQLKITLDCGYTHASMLQVGLMDNASDLSSFVPFDSSMTVAWRTTFYNRMRQGCHLAFRVPTSALFRIDTLIVEQSTVHPVDNLHRTACTPTSMTIDWTEQGQATRWLVRSQQEEDGFDTVFVATAKPCTISGLQPYTPQTLRAYNITVRALSGADTSLPVYGRFATAPADHHTALRIETDTLGPAGATYQPFNRTNKHTWTQLLYPMTQYATAGWIDTVWFHCQSRVNLNQDQDTSVTLYMGISDFDHAEGPSDWVPEERLHRVWHGSTLTADSNNQWVPIVLDSAFYYDGRGNLALVFSRNFNQQYYSFDSYNYTHMQQGVVLYRAGADTTFAQYPSTIGSRNGTLFPNLPVTRFSFYTANCYNVDSLRVVNSRYDSVTLAWHPQGGEHDWQVVYWGQNGARGSALVSGTPQTTLSGLRGSQMYWFQVRPVCGAGDTGLFYGIDSCTVVSCPSPANLAVTALGDSTATLSWSGMSPVQQGKLVIGSPDGSQSDTIPITGNQATLTGLQPRTYYVAKVQGFCATGDTSTYSPTLTFRTTGMGMAYNLAQVGDPNAPHINGPAPIEVFWKHGWSQTIYEADSIGTYGYIDTLWYYAEQVGTDRLDTSVTIYMGHTPLASHPSDSAWLQASNLTQVYHSPSVLPSATGWFPIVLNPPFEYNGRDNLAVVISYHATNWTTDWKFAYQSNMPHYYLRRGHDTDESYGAHPGTIPGSRVAIMPLARFSMAVDTLAPPFCTQPHGVHVAADTGGNALLSWRSYLNDSLYMCRYRSADATDSGTIVTPSTSLSLPMLLPGKHYRISLSTLCRSGESSEPVEVEFTTSCRAVARLPWIDGFETLPPSLAQGHEPLCWRIYGDSLATALVDTEMAYMGRSCLKLSGNGSSAVTAVLPDFDTALVDVASLLLSFHAFSPAGGAVDIAVGTIQPGNEPYAFLPVDTVTAVAIYARQAIPMTHHDVQGSGLALRVFSPDNNPFVVYLDNVEVQAIANPAGVFVDGVTQHGATVHIADSSAATWHTVLLASHSPQGADTMLYYTADTVLQLQGLTPGTHYRVAVRNEYEDGAYHSRWTDTVAFRTPDEVHWYQAAGQSNDASLGYVVVSLVEGADSLAGQRLYSGGSLLEFSARTSQANARFVGWDDGNDENPRRLLLTQDTVLTALFERTEGIDPVASQWVSLQPNPARNKVEVKAQMPMDGIECRDAVGRLVTRHKACGTRLVIDVAAWPAGVYYVKITAQGQTSMLKLMVQ